MDRRKKVAAVGMVCLAMGLLLGRAAAAEMSLDEAFKQLAAYKFGQSRVALTVISDHVRDSAKAPADRRKLAAKLAGMVGSAAVTTDAKRFICRKLSLIGEKTEVPALAKLLTDKDLADMGRYALERMPCPEAVAAMRAALGQTTGRTRIGLINSLGERRDAACADELVTILSGADADLAEAAAAALGKIGGEKALSALGAARAKAPAKLKPAVTNSLLVCADQMLAAGKKDAAAEVYQKLYVPAEPKRVRIAALQGLVSSRGAAAAALVLDALRGKDAEMRAVASGHVRSVPGADVTKAFAAELGKLPSAAKVLVLAALADRGDKAALPAVMEATQSADAGVRDAALQAAGSLGDASCVPALAKFAATSPQAQQALARVSGKGVDAAIVQAMEKADPKAKAALIRALSARKATSATPAVLQAVQDADGSVRAEAIKALGQMGDPKALPQMVQLLLKATGGDQSNLAQSIAMVARGVKDEAQRVAPILAALEGADAKAKAALLMVLGRIGSPKALNVLKASLNDPAVEVQDAAVRALSNWPDEGAAPELLNVAKTHRDLKLQVLALRGYVNVAGKVQDTRKRLDMLAAGVAAAKRPEEKRMFLGAIAGVPDRRSVSMLTQYLDDPALKREAAAGIFSLARDRRLRRAREFKAARAKILANFTDKKTLDQAKKLPQ